MSEIIQEKQFEEKLGQQAQAWRTFTVHYDGRDFVFDPNQWVIIRENGVAEITQDGVPIDQPRDTGQTDAELVRWGIVWCMIDDVESALR
jgi:hypothetical protein